MKTWSTLEFNLAIESLGIPRKSQIFIHSSLGMLGVHEQSKPASVVLNYFERLAEAGTKVYLPAFTYSVSQGQVFNPKSEIGLPQMGALSVEAFSRN